jgi:agmatine/peptidylarginine deiminase
MHRVRFVEVAYDDTWLRDSGPITLQESDGFRLLDFRFTGWGGKFEASRDDQLVEALSGTGIFLKNTRQPIDFALEGGAIDTDGAGTLLSTWQCLHERHPELDRPTLTAMLADWLQQDRVLWLDHGYLEGDDTDAHIDTLARFAAPDAIVFQACDDPMDSHYAELQSMADEIAALRTRNGQPYRLFPLPWAKPIVDDDRRLAASYANFLIINGAVLMPVYGDEADARAQVVLAQAFPGRDIIPVPCRPLIWQNGSLHCITMQLPAGLV